MTTLHPASAAGADQLSRRAWGTLIVLCGALFLDALDVSMMGVALPSIRADLHMSTSSLQWVVSGYVLGYGGFLLLGGRAADLFGRRRMFLSWLGIFVVASGLGGLATGGELLVAARFVTGVSAAFTACPSSRPRSKKARRATGRCRSTPRRVRPGSRSGSSSAAC
jgi:MFS family permease